MTGEHEAKLILSDGRAVLVEYTATGGSKPVTSGPPEHCDPGEAPEITIVRAFLLEEGEERECVLSDDEDARLCEHLASTHEEPEDCGDGW